MAYNPYQPQLNAGQVQALLAGWYDIVGPQVGRHVPYAPYAGHQGGRMSLGYPTSYGYPPYVLGADPAAPPLPPMPQMAPPMMAPPEAYPFPPRGAVVSAPMPTKANRDILPMSTGVPILPTQSAQITGRPQCLVYVCNRFMISNAGTAGGAADWIVNDIKIGNRSQFVQSGDVPGDLFASNAIDTFVRFEAAQTAMDVVVVVTYIGLNESGAPFFGAMVGTAAI